MIGAYKKYDWSGDAHMTAIFTDLETESVKLTAAIKRLKTESELEQKDEIRDDKVRAIHYLLLGFIHHPDPTIKSAAQVLETVFENYGLHITGENYATESSLIASLLGDLANPDLQPDITAVSGCADIIAALQSAQTDFETTRIAWEEEKAKEGSKLNASKIKMDVLKIINDKIVVYLRAMVQVDEIKYGEFAATIGQMIADNNEMVKKRRKKPEPVA
jgi:hypothetical protein